IYAEIATLWLTREVIEERPTVIDEVKSALYYFRRTLLDVVPELMRDLEWALQTYLPPSGSGEGTSGSVPNPRELTAPLPPILKFCSWIGGDRDGNPYVTPEVTRGAYELQAAVANEAYLADIDLLVQRLSLWERRAPLTHHLREALEERAAAIGAGERFAGEPYRLWLEQMHRLLLAEAAEAGTYPGGSAGYQSDLRLLEQALQFGQSERPARTFVRPAAARAAAFGFAL